MHVSYKITLCMHIKILKVSENEFGKICIMLNYPSREYMYHRSWNPSRELLMFLCNSTILDLID